VMISYGDHPSSR